MECDPAFIALHTGWAGFLGGVISGAIIGLQFHKETWLGGYGSRERRMLRLGHIACFGIGMVCLFYGLCLRAEAFERNTALVGACALVVAQITMPAVCFLSAWKSAFRHLFFIPVLSASVGIFVQLKEIL